MADGSDSILTVDNFEEIFREIFVKIYTRHKSTFDGFRVLTLLNLPSQLSDYKPWIFGAKFEFSLANSNFAPN